MRDKLVREILTAVVAAVDVPVTLKMRTGWSRNHINALEIAHMAEDRYPVFDHPRSQREDKYNGEAGIRPFVQSNNR